MQARTSGRMGTPACSPDLLLLQGVLLLLQSWDQLPNGGRGLPTGLLGTPAGACSPGATGHPALVARRRHLNVDQKVYLG